jgi:HlyD family secretion protein
MTVTATIITSLKDNTIVVSSSAIKTNNGVKTVQVVDPNTINQSDPKIKPSIQTVTVTTGISNDTQTEVLTGLNDGDTVITGIVQSGGTTSSSSSSSLINLGGGAATGRTGGAAGGFGGGAARTGAGG